MKPFIFITFFLVHTTSSLLSQVKKLSKNKDTQKTNVCKLDTLQNLSGNAPISALKSNKVASDNKLGKDSIQKIKETGLLDIHQFASDGDLVSLKKELDEGIYVDIPTLGYFDNEIEFINHQTPLMYAVQNHKVEACKLLLLYGADPYLKNAEKKTAFDLAKAKQYQDILKIFATKQCASSKLSVQEALQKAEEAYQVREFVVANSFANIAHRSFNTINTPNQKKDYNKTLILLAKSYEKIYVLPKAEFYFNKLIEISNTNGSSITTEYASAVLELASFYTRTSSFEKASVLLGILTNWSEEQSSIDKMTKAKIMDAQASLLNLQHDKDYKSWINNALKLKKQLVGECDYEYALSLLQAYNSGTQNRNLKEETKSNEVKNLFNMVGEEITKKQFGVLKAFGYDDIVQETFESLKTKVTADSLQQYMNNYEKSVNVSIKQGGAFLGDMFYKYLVLFGNEEITYTGDIVNNLVEVIKMKEGELSENYLKALNFQTFAFQQAKQFDLAQKNQKYALFIKNRIADVNFQRGLAYYPDTLLEHNNLPSFQNIFMPSSANLTESLEFWFRQKSIVENIYGKVNRYYISVLTNLANGLKDYKDSRIPDYFNKQKDILITYLGTYHTNPTIQIDESAYNTLFKDLETYRNSIKQFMVLWSKKNSLVNNYLFDFIINDKQKILLKVQKAKQNNFSSNLTSDLESELAGLFSKTGQPITYKDIYGMNPQQHANMLTEITNIARNIAMASQKFLDIGNAVFESGEQVNPSASKSSWKDIASVLKKNEVIVEYFYLDKSKIYSDSTKIEYYALIAKSGSPHITLKYLCLSDDIKEQQYTTSTDLKKNSYFRGEDSKEKNNKQDNLYKLCWKPIERLLNPSDTVIYYSPSGKLEGISFVAINTPDGNILGDKYRLTYLSSSKRLLEKQSDLKINKQLSIQLWGNPKTNAENLRDALQEVKKIKNIFESKTKHIDSYREKEATETLFKKINSKNSSPSIVHIAAHGGFISEKSDTLTNKLLNSYLLMTNGDPKQAPKSPKFYSNDDGILTAYEIAQLNFSNTSLVVLSACNSGLGNKGSHEEGDEGVGGLQRAFKIAGAEYLIVSLRSVPDDFTLKLMESFYTHLSNGFSIPIAFEKSQKEMRVQKHSTSEWGSFILIH